MIINCPSCSSSFKVTVAAVDHTGRKYSADSPITPAAMKAVFEFMQRLGPGRYSNAVLIDGYNRKQAHDRGINWPVLSTQALMMALKRNGAEKWRTSSERGWIIPEMGSLARPAPVARSVRDDLEEQDFRETIEAHRGGRPDDKPFDPADLPFQMDVPSDATIDSNYDGEHA